MSDPPALFNFSLDEHHALLNLLPAPVPAPRCNRSTRPNHPVAKLASVLSAHDHANGKIVIVDQPDERLREQSGGTRMWCVVRSQERVRFCDDADWLPPDSF
jgi:hypothetical protein